jgi:hypothetical protein
MQQAMRWVRMVCAARQRAQNTVEWVIGAAVLAFIAMAAWTNVGTAITSAFTRLIAMVNQVGV